MVRADKYRIEMKRERENHHGIDARRVRRPPPDPTPAAADARNATTNDEHCRDEKRTARTSQAPPRNSPLALEPSCSRRSARR